MTAEQIYDVLKAGAAGNTAAIRSIAALQPAGGEGDKVFPPTYAGAVYAKEKRLIGGEPVETVLLDSVQSVANRFEEALLSAVDGKQLGLPMLEMKVAGHRVNSLTAPHRIHDAIFRDSLWDGVPFRESPNGKRIAAARAWNATAFYEFAPTVLLFGTWDSQSGGGTNSAKIARSLVSEIIGMHAVNGVRTSSRIDPLGIKLLRNVIGMTNEKDASTWFFIPPTAEAGAKKPKKDEPKGFKPSQINHGNIAPSITEENGPGGVTIKEARETSVLSLAQLRKLRFPIEDEVSPERDVAGRTVIAALGLHAVALLRESGYQLRSRCQLIPVEAPVFEILGPTQSDRETFTCDSTATKAVFDEAVAAAKKQGLVWDTTPVVLTPKPDLIKLVELSDKSVSDAEQE